MGSNSFRFSLIYLNLLKILFLIVFIGFVVLIASYYTFPEYISTHFRLYDDSGLFWSSNGAYVETKAVFSVTLDELSSWQRVFLFVKGSSFLILIYLGLNTLDRVIRDIKDGETFYNSNILAFKRLYKISLGLLILSVFSIDINSTSSINLGLSFWAVGVCFVCRMMIHIFEEGNRIVEENRAFV